MPLIHIHVPTCVDVPISLDHVTTQNKHYLNFSVHLSIWKLLYYHLHMANIVCEYLLIYMKSIKYNP